MNRSVVALCVTAAFVSAPSASARQTAPVPAHPIFSGVWIPVNTKAGNTFFAAFVSPVSGGAKLSLDQRPSRITVSIDLPEEDLDRLHKSFFASAVYPISNRPVGGNGAGPGRPVDAAWDGEALIIPSFSSWGGAQRGPVSLTFSLDGSHLSLKWQWQVPGAARANTVIQLLERAK